MYNGIFSFKNGKHFCAYLGLKRPEPTGKHTRHHLSPIIGIDNFFQKLNDENIKYSILRWFEDLPNINLNEDIDLLVEDVDLEKIHCVIDKHPGIIPFDIYSITGKPGSDYQSLPYYIHSLADKILNETTLFKGKYRVPSPENYFYSLAYHSVFHKGENSGLNSKSYELKIQSNPDHDYITYLKRTSLQANLSIDDFTLEGLHELLDTKGFAPPIDTLYKLSINNQYLKFYLNDFQKKSEHPSKFEGLVCFVARERIIEKKLLDELLKYIRKEGFTILRVVNLEGQFKTNFIKYVRGGNWNQGPWPVSGGLPSVVIVALDVYPVEPNPSDFYLHPGITNRRIINKNEIRDFINKSLADESEWFNGIHSSDNEIQALDYLSLAGINENEIYSEIEKHKKTFITKYPVLGVLSQYSKRAKVELIDFNGKKAVKKTFKPDCEGFLKNEVKVYTLFQDILPIPELLEVGENCIITKYIEGSRPFGSRISLKRLKKCIDILQKVYEQGYSLLDFKPANFLIDTRNNIYLIDFEFLHKYETKPDFLNCYDLVGIPNTIDKAYVPNYYIPKGVKQFDALWFDFTGVYYKELSKLDSIMLMIKSSYRFYKFRAKDLVNRFIRINKKAVKKIFRYLP
jgi:predicted Ser/Thr protein kinase